MRIVRVAVAAGVLALLGLLVWDVAHGRGGVAQKVDTGKIVRRSASSTCPASTARAA